MNTNLKPSFLSGLALAVLAAQPLLAEKPVISGPFPFEPLTESVAPGSLPFDAPWLLPPGFQQVILSDESDLNIYDGINLFPDTQDVNDMNTENETGRQRGRYLYHTHEVRPGAAGNGNSGGAVSVVDTHTGAAKILVQRDDWEALDGIRWTPWGTILCAEEATDSARPDPDYPTATSGLLYEIILEKNDLTTAKEVIARPAVGALAHEGIEVDEKGNVYVIDERTPGSIYKFVPDARGDLSSGQLYALKVEDSVSRTGVADWVALDRNQVQIRAFTAAQAVGATGWGRPEDVEIIRGVLYVAITSENKVVSVTLNTQRPFVSNFVEAGVNAPIEGPTGYGTDTGFDSLDNLASDNAGNLWIVEDNVPSDIWVATPDLNGDGRADSVNLFASMADAGAEGTGLYFGQDPHALYINVQHSASGNDKTMLIFKYPGKSGK